MDKNELRKIVFPYVEKINKELYEMVIPRSRLTMQIFNQVMKTGKRLRPLLVIYSALCSKYNKDMKSLYRLGAIIELVHTASLLHDDVIDDAEMRRGVVSSNRLFGDEASILTGDYMYSLAYNMVLHYEDKRIAKKISEAAYILSEGEIKELENTRNIRLTEEEYLETIYMKTGVLIEASSIVGVMFAGCGEERIKLFSDMGKNLGIAFQIYDDVLDYMGTEEKIGKETMKDIREGKITMPLIYGLHKDNDLMNVLKDFSINTKELLKIKRMVEKKGGIDYSLEKAKSYAERARKAISSIESSPEKAILEALIDYSVSREN